MGVYIKGVEMPTNGEILCINIHPDGKVCIALDLECKQIATAVPVPPHGRLIDADALDGIMVEQSGEEYNHHHAPRTWERALSCFRDYIKDAPTIIEAEEEA